MSRISFQDAARLGIDLDTMPAGARGLLVIPRAKAGRHPVVPTSLAKSLKAESARADAKARQLRKSTKSGRLRRVHAEGTREITFFVPGVPVTKQRARTFLDPALIMRAFQQCRGDAEAFRAAIGGLRHRTVTPKETADYTGLVGRVAAAAMRSTPPFDGPVVMELLFTFDGDDGLWPTDVTDPDIDNVEKAVMDAVKGIVWHDDRLVVGMSSLKVCGPEPGVRVKVRAASAAQGLSGG